MELLFTEYIAEKNSEILGLKLIYIRMRIEILLRVRIIFVSQ